MNEHDHQTDKLWYMVHDISSKKVKSAFLVLLNWRQIVCNKGLKTYSHKGGMILVR